MSATHPAPDCPAIWSAATSRACARSGRLSARRIAWLVGIAFACALALAALRIDILRVRYALGEAIREEKALVQQQRQQTAALEGLRNPSRLVEVAQRARLRAARARDRPAHDARERNGRSAGGRETPMRSADVRKSARRVAIARAALLFTFAVLAARAAHLSVFDERGARARRQPGGAAG